MKINYLYSGFSYLSLTFLVEIKQEDYAISSFGDNGLLIIEVSV